MKKYCKFLSQIFNFTFLCCCIFVVTGCDQEPKEKFPPRAKKIPANEQYPKGYSEVVMGDYMMLIPGGVTKHVDSNGHVRIYASWPEFEFHTSEIFRSNATQTTIDTISIFVRPPRYTISREEYHQWSKEYKQDKREQMLAWENQWQQSEEFSGFLEKLSPINSKPEFYTLKDHSVLDPFRFPAIFHCSTENSDLDWDTFTEKDMLKMVRPLCGTRIRWPDGHSIRIRFYRKHLKDAFNIYQKIIELHNSFIISTSNSENNKGNK